MCIKIFIIGIEGNIGVPYFFLSFVVIIIALVCVLDVAFRGLIC